MIMLGDYPFYIVQPTEEMDKVFEANAEMVRKALGDSLTSIRRVGSSAIKGMPGTPVVDLCACVKEFPLSEGQLAALAE